MSFRSFVVYYRYETAIQEILPSPQKPVNLDIHAYFQEFVKEKCITGKSCLVFASNLWYAFNEFLYEKNALYASLGKNSPDAFTRVSFSDKECVLGNTKISRSKFNDYFNGSFGSKESKVSINGVRSRGWKGIYNYMKSYSCFRDRSYRTAR